MVLGLPAEHIPYPTIIFAIHVQIKSTLTL
jgi:hypothetical protein